MYKLLKFGKIHYDKNKTWYHKLLTLILDKKFMYNFRQFLSENYIFFDKIANSILRKMCFLQQKSVKIAVFSPTD